MQIQKGQIVAFTTGQYSDYCLRGHMRALVDFETADVVAQFNKTERSKDSDIMDWGNQSFMAWLIKARITEPLNDDVVEWNIGSCGKVSA